MQPTSFTMAKSCMWRILQARNFANPLHCFTADDRVLLPSQTIIAYQKEKLILTNGAKLDRWDIRNNPAYEIKPRQK